MELWIRSQDKECLMKVDRIDYDYSALTHRIVVNGYKTLVGLYETKERALEILDDISKQIKNSYLVEIMPIMKPSYYEKVEKDLNTKYYGEFIMEPPATKIEPINSNIIFYEMPLE